MSNTKILKVKANKEMICNSKRMFEITRNLCFQFKHEDMQSTMAVLARENLMLLSHLYAASSDTDGLVNSKKNDTTSGKDPVNWAIHRLSYCIRGMKTEAIPARHGVLGWFIDLTSKYPKQIKRC